MRVLLLIILLFLALKFALGVLTGVTVQGGKLSVTGGYLAVDPSVASQVVIISTSTVGQCIGILCGITKAN